MACPSRRAALRRAFEVAERFGMAGNRTVCSAVAREALAVHRMHSALASRKPALQRIAENGLSTGYAH